MRSLMLGLLLLALSAPAAIAADEPAVRLLDMYAKAEGEDYKIYIIADGDITGYQSSRKLMVDTYRLTVDVPALPPVDTRYDVHTPFSRQFQVWPMKLEKQVYSRIEIELDQKATTVVGSEGPNRVTITISRSSPRAVVEQPPAAAPQAAEAAPVAEVEGEVALSPVDAPAPPSTHTVPAGNGGDMGIGDALQAASAGQSQPMAENLAEYAPSDNGSSDNGSWQDGDAQAAAGAEQSEMGDAQFFSLFPSGVATRPILAEPFERAETDEVRDGVQLGRFLFRPSLSASWIRGSNLLLRSDLNAEDTSLLIRARTAVELLYTNNPLQIVYEARYRDFREFVLEEHLSHFVDVRSTIHLSPRAVLELGDRLVRGSFEAPEFDPGQEVFFSTDPFFRNMSRAGFRFDLSERLGLEVRGTNNRVHFLDENPATFFDYQTTTAGAGFLYYLSPLSTVFGQYERTFTPRPSGRPQAESTADAVLVGIRGDITPLVVGTIRAGFQRQDFVAPEQADFRGLVADVSLTRFFSELAALTVEAGRTTNLSAFGENAFYTSNRLYAQLALPVARNIRLTASASVYDNHYPVVGTTGVERDDRAIAGSAGLAYFFSPVAFFRADYRHERRSSSLDPFQYRNNVLQFMFGIGFFSRM